MLPVSLEGGNSGHKDAILVQDSPESLIAIEHLNHSIHDAVGKNASEIPLIWNYCEFSDRN